MSMTRATMTTRGSAARPDGPSGARLLAALALWIAVSATAGFATASLAATIAPGWAADPNNVAVIVVAEVYGLLIVTLGVVFRGRDQRRRALGLTPVDRRAVGVGVLAWVAAYVVAFAGYGMVEMFASPEPSILDVLWGIGSDAGRLQGAGGVMTLLILARACVLAPVGEELLFRGVLYAWLRRRLAAAPTIATTAALWTVIHQVPIVMPLAFVVGLAAGWARERTGSVVPVLVAHVIQNVVIVTASGVLTGWTAELPL
jgi:membrane protease YdiL (CAAX protease family)